MKNRLGIMAALLFWAFPFSAALIPAQSQAQTEPPPVNRDETVRSFLQSMRGRWHDMNVSSADGRILLT